jgi:MYXO-CTERM domain-containing protein
VRESEDTMTRIRTEIAIAVIFAALAVTTAIWPTWIESIFDQSPDAGTGTLEWTIVGLFGLLALVAIGLARRDVRALRRA